MGTMAGARSALPVLAAIMLLAAGFGVGAAPFVPDADTTVLERLPAIAAGDRGELRRWQSAAIAAPADPMPAVALANAWYRRSRSEGDPRYLGYAQAALARWWANADAPTEVLVARAAILQSNHEFDRARADLDRALAREPRHARALLVRSTVLTVQGRHAAARADCARLFGVAPELYVVACVATIDSLTGRSAAAKASLERALSGRSVADAEGRAWAHSLLGEIDHRRADPAAEVHFRAALAADPRDLYTRGAYADWLLEQGRDAEVIALVRHESRVDGMLLRLALAQAALRQPEADASVAILRARFDASRARGDTVHRREEARFQLRLNGDAASALRLAKLNWAVQREPADLAILVAAGVATGDVATLGVARDWLSATGLEYAAVATTARVSGPGRP